MSSNPPATPDRPAKLEVVVAAYGEVRRQNDAARALLRRLLQWDHLPLTGDGPYWMREIEKVLRND